MNDDICTVILPNMETILSYTKKKFSHIAISRDFAIHLTNHTGYAKYSYGSAILGLSHMT